MSLRISPIARIGIVVSIALALLIWGINFLKGKDLLNKDNDFYAIYDQIGGLTEANSIKINGYKIGHVGKITLMPESNQLLVHLLIRSDIKVPEGSIALIASADLMGTKEIDLIMADSIKTYHESGDTLIAKAEGTLKEQVSIQMLPLKEKAEDLMKSMENALAIVEYIFNEKTRDNLAKSFENIKKTVDNLESTTRNLDTLVVNEKGKLARILSNIESISTNLKNNNEQISNIIKNFSSISDSLARSQIASTINNANNAISQADSIIGKINRGEGSIGQLINNDVLYKNLESSSLNLSKLLDDIQRNPKRYVRFSLFDLGRTVNMVEDKKKEKEKK